MSDFHNREEFEKWLSDKPRDWAVVLAVRSALRVLPALAAARQAEDFSSAVVLPVIRATVVVWATASLPTKTWEMANPTNAAAAAAAAAATAVAATTTAVTAYAANAAANAAYTAVYAAHDAARVAANAAVYAANAAANASIGTNAAIAANASAELWRAVSKDATGLEAGGTAPALAMAPLWRNSVPGWSVKGFRRLREILFARNENWQVWIDWYRSCVKGSGTFGLPVSAAGELGIHIATQDSDWWERGPKAVNADIAAWVAEVQVKVALDDAREVPGSEALGKPAVSDRQQLTVKDFIVSYLENLGQRATNKDILAAFESAKYPVKRKTVEWALVQLNNEKVIIRLDRGLYVHSSVPLGPLAEQSLPPTPDHTKPKPVKGIASPFEFGINADKRITLTADALGQIRVPGGRSQNDANLRVEAARQISKDLIADIAEDHFQVRKSYQTHLERYRDRLPHNGNGNIYEADAEMRSLRDQLVADLKYGMDEIFAQRLVRVLEQHAGLRVYFPDLLVFYDDVREGLASEPPPLEAFERLGKVVAEFTPDVFEQNVGKSLGDIEARSSVAQPQSSQFDDVAKDQAIVLPPDPIADVDPIRAAQHAKAGAFNRLWATLLKLEKTAKGIDRAEKAVSVYQRYIGPILDWLSGLPPPPNG